MRSRHVATGAGSEGRSWLLLIHQIPPRPAYLRVRIGRRLALRALRVTPQWVPVLRGASSASITRDQIIEVEGIVTRSYGDPIEPPFFQWHTWLNWSIQVRPEEKYGNVVSPAATPPTTEDAQGGETAIARAGSFEIQWDAGALFEQPMTFGGGFNDPFASGFRDTDMPDVPLLPKPYRREQLADALRRILENRDR